MLDSNALAAEEAVERFCAENERLAHSFDALPSRGHAHDAASFLSTRIAFDDHPGSLTLSAPLSAAMDDSGWRRFSGEELNGLDFGWMHELLAYDHWSLENTNVFHDAPGGLLDAPMPDYRQLQLWVKLRLVKGRAEGNLSQATTEVLHLAGLIQSSGTLLASMVATSMVGIVDSVWREVGQVPPVSLADDAARTRARRAMVIAPQFLWPHVDPKVRARALGCMLDPCSAVAEALNANTVVGDASAAAELRAMAPGCDLKLLDRVLRAPVVGPRWAAHEVSALDAIEDWQRTLEPSGP